MFYSGDFDAEGLSIAARLQARYPDALQLWHMEAGDYAVCCSKNRLDEAKLRGFGGLPLDEAKLRGFGGLPEGTLKQTAKAMQKAFTYSVCGLPFVPKHENIKKIAEIDVDSGGKMW